MIDEGQYIEAVRKAVAALSHGGLPVTENTTSIALLAGLGLLAEHIDGRTWLQIADELRLAASELIEAGARLADQRKESGALTELKAALEDAGPCVCGHAWEKHGDLCGCSECQCSGWSEPVAGQPTTHYSPREDSTPHG